MLTDLDTHRDERVLFTLRLDHNVRLPPVERGEQRVPVSEVHGVGVRPRPFLGVLARQVELGPHAPRLPGRQREVQGILQREATGVEGVVQGVGDRRDAEGAGCPGDLRDGPDSLVILDRQVAKQRFFRPEYLD